MGAIAVKRLRRLDIEKIVPIYLGAFRGMTKGEEVKRWMGCRIEAFPQVLCYGAWRDGELHGYIVWEEYGGFRANAVFELEQIAVLSQYRGQGIGSQLIVDSLADIKAYLKKRGATLKLVEILTGVENEAQKLYAKTLGAKSIAIIPARCHGDERMMVARFNGK